LKIEDIGEFGLIEYLKRKFSLSGKWIGIGDDCCFIPPDIVLTSDMMVEGVHFDLKYLTPEDVGCRATTACLSDLAAVGARPVGFMLSLGIKPDLDYSFFKAIFNGVAGALQEAGVRLLGGDLSRSSKLILSGFAIGRTRRPVLRSGASPGDYIYLTGYTGLAEAGRIVLKRGVSLKRYRESVKRHRRPYPQVKLGQKLKRVASSMIDVSDGLLLDLSHLAEESQVGISIHHLPIHPELIRLEQEFGIRAETLALSGGEDFELIFTSKKRLRKFWRIGEVISEEGIWFQGRRIRPRGYEHFRR